MKTTKEAGIIRAGEGRKLNVLGHDITVKVSSEQTGGDYYVFEVVTPPGHGIPPHVHQGEDEVIEVVEGDYGIFIGGENFHASKGDILHFARHTPHAFQNVGDRPGKTLWTVMPGASFEAFFEELAALPPGPPDMGKVVEVFGRYNMEVLLPPQ
jgi:quercetin dioxygenase-like cupin family protein